MSDASGQCEPPEIASEVGSTMGGTSVFFFGQSLDASATTCVVGAPLTILPGPVNYYGSVHIFDLSPNALTPRQLIVSPPSGGVTFFGSDVSIHEDMIAISSPGHIPTSGTGGPGCVFIYELLSGVWSQTAQIHAPALVPPVTSFGHSIALGEDILFVGIPAFSNGQGAVAVYRRLAGGWQFQSLVVAADGLPGDGFGTSVSARSGRVAIGSYGDDSQVLDQGSVYVMDYSLANVTKLAGPAIPGGIAGYRLDLGDDILTISRKSGPTTSSSGVVDVMRFDGNDWIAEAVLAPSKKNYYFGASVSVGGDRIAVVDCASPALNQADGVDLYEFDTSGWNLVARAHSANPGYGDPNHPSQVSLVDARLVMGIPSAYLPPGTGAGRVVLFAADSGVGTFGVSCAGELGFEPELALQGCATSNGNLQLSISGGVGGSVAVILFGLNKAAISIGGGCLLQVVPTLAPLIVLPLSGSGPGQGSVSVSASLPTMTPLVSFTMQAFCEDTTAVLGFSATKGIEVSIQ